MVAKPLRHVACRGRRARLVHGFDRDADPVASAALGDDDLRLGAGLLSILRRSLSSCTSMARVVDLVVVVPPAHLDQLVRASPRGWRSPAARRGG